jgi:hypothetical protein
MKSISKKKKIALIVVLLVIVLIGATAFVYKSQIIEKVQSLFQSEIKLKGADLIVTDIKWSKKNPAVGDVITFSAVIKNIGKDASFDNRVYSVDFMVDGVSVNVALPERDGIAPGKSVTIVADSGPAGTSTWVATEGVHTVRAYVDYLLKIGETKEVNNALDEKLTVGDPNQEASIGAALNYVELEAEAGKTDGKVSGVDTTLLSVEAEASGRQYVRLEKEGQSVEWVAPSTADSIVVRYSIPDSSDGKGLESNLKLYINGVFQQDIILTSKYAWVYGDFPWTNRPGNGKGHKFFDEVHAKMTEIQPGDVISLKMEGEDLAAYTLIDLIDLEKIPDPIVKPENYLSIEDYGAISGDGEDDTEAVTACMRAAKEAETGVWIPEGEYLIRSIRVDNVTFQGAGMWYSIFVGAQSRFICSGNYCKFYDFAIFGETSSRDDNSATDNAFSGVAGYGSVLDGIWIEHKKCGFWVGEPSNKVPTNNLWIRNCRIRNLMADGINLCNGTSNTVIENCSLRYTGDDSLATWSANNAIMGCNNNIFRNNTIQLPWLASGISIYGGSNHLIENNLVKDTVTGGSGIYISTNFTPITLAGTITASHNTLIRCGSNECYTGYVPGAIRILAYDSDIKAKIIVKDINIVDAVKSGITIQGPKKMTNVSFSDIRIDGAKAYGIQIQSNASGSASFKRTVMTNVQSGIGNSAGSQFKVKKGWRNRGW